MSARATRRIVIAVGLLVVFGAGVSMVMLSTPPMAQSRAASEAPAAAASKEAQDLGPAPDASAAARDATTAAPPGASSQGQPAPSSQPQPAAPPR